MKTFNPTTPVPDKRLCIPILVAHLFLIVTSCSLARAHEGGHGESISAKTKSTWTLKASGNHLHGTFLSADKTHVKIETAQGKSREIEIQKLCDQDQRWITEKLRSIQHANESASQPKTNPILNPSNPSRLVSTSLVLDTQSDPQPSIHEHFLPFEKTLGLRWDNDFYYVESNGIPDHPMMVGITAWQQQVPMPQSYTGRNAWRIPLHPKPAAKPMSAKTNFFRGAIALAVNGIPIFNPIKNDGKTDTLIAGELDQYGGHCGRADDYHYHIAPVHLEPVVGRGNPIAYALDGYPIFGYQDPQDPDYAALDQWNGHQDKQGSYHYHATKNYPYLNGGFYGEVVERDGQVDPQPRAQSPRPALPPLRGARIVGFEETSSKSYQLTYEISGKKGFVRYTLAADGSAAFEFQDPQGNVRKENYKAPGPRREPPEKAPSRNDRPRDRNGNRDRNNPQANVNPKAQEPSRNSIQLTSSSIDRQSRISKDCTCDGAGHSPAIAWDNLPPDTQSVVISLWHKAPDQEKSYWLVYNIDPMKNNIPENATSKDFPGTLGLNDKKKNSYDPMCSRGPGVKSYSITLYALSKKLELDSKTTDRKKLLEAIKDCTLGESTLEYQYERPR